MTYLRKIAALVLAAAMLFGFCAGIFAADSMDCGAKLLAITFDDGPGQYTGYLLDELAERGVHATFFVAGYRAVQYPETLKRIVNEGHQLANHTYNHEDLNTLSAEKIQQEASSTQRLITAAGGSESAYIRPPYGNANSKVRSALDVPLIIWSVDPVDWKVLNTATVSDNIVSGAYDGSIILVHDIYKTSVNGALDAIDRLQAKGYEFVTVEELLLRRGVTVQGGTTYYDAKNKGINLSAYQISPEYYDETKLKEHWAYKEMLSAMESGFLDSGPNGEWFPNRYITRGDFVTALAKYCGVRETYPVSEDLYSDVTDHTLQIYTSWAYDAGLMNGFSNGTFRPEQTLTREQMATVIARYVISRGKQVPAPLHPRYDDVAEISSWALEGVSLCTELGILNGTNGSYRPKGTLTRAQTAAILQRLSKL